MGFDQTAARQSSEKAKLYADAAKQKEIPEKMKENKSLEKAREFVKNPPVTEKAKHSAQYQGPELTEQEKYQQMLEKVSEYYTDNEQILEQRKKYDEDFEQAKQAVERRVKELEKSDPVLAKQLKNFVAYGDTGFNKNAFGIMGQSADFKDKLKNPENVSSAEKYADTTDELFDEETQKLINKYQCTWATTKEAVILQGIIRGATLDQFESFSLKGTDLIKLSREAYPIEFEIAKKIGDSLSGIFTDVQESNISDILKKLGADKKVEKVLKRDVPWSMVDSIIEEVSEDMWKALIEENLNSAKLK